MAGLSAGCYAQMNGYTTQIFEQNVTPGGVCTSWTLGNPHSVSCSFFSTSPIISLPFFFRSPISTIYYIPLLSISLEDTEYDVKDNQYNDYCQQHGHETHFFACL